MELNVLWVTHSGNLSYPSFVVWFSLEMEEILLRLQNHQKMMRLVSVKMPEALIEGMDELVRRGAYPSRSAVMRTAVRDLLKKELWK